MGRHHALPKVPTFLSTAATVAFPQADQLTAASCTKLITFCRQKDDEEHTEAKNKFQLDLKKKGTTSIGDHASCFGGRPMSGGPLRLFSQKSRYSAMYLREGITHNNTEWMKVREDTKEMCGGEMCA